MEEGAHKNPDLTRWDWETGSDQYYAKFGEHTKSRFPIYFVRILYILWLLILGLSCARHYSKWFTHMDSLNSYKCPREGDNVVPSLLMRKLKQTP